MMMIWRDDVDNAHWCWCHERQQEQVELEGLAKEAK